MELVKLRFMSEESEGESEDWFKSWERVKDFLKSSNLSDSNRSKKSIRIRPKSNGEYPL